MCSHRASSGAHSVYAVCAPRASRSLPQRLGAFDSLALATVVHGLPEIGTALNIEPEVRRVAEYPRKDQGGRRRHCPPAIAELIHVLALHSHGRGKRGLRESERSHELLHENLSDRG